jgi:hypothetical protein
VVPQDAPIAAPKRSASCKRQDVDNGNTPIIFARATEERTCGQNLSTAASLTSHSLIEVLIFWGFLDISDFGELSLGVFNFYIR